MATLAEIDELLKHHWDVHKEEPIMYYHPPLRFISAGLQHRHNFFERQIDAFYMRKRWWDEKRRPAHLPLAVALHRRSKLHQTQSYRIMEEGCLNYIINSTQSPYGKSVLDQIKDDFINKVHAAVADMYGIPSDYMKEHHDDGKFML